MLLLLFALTPHIWLLTRAQIEGSAERRLAHYLFSNQTYTTTKGHRPVRNSTQIMVVSFNLKMWQLIDVDEKGEKFKAQCYYQMEWTNELLVWNPQEWGGVDMLVVDLDKVCKKSLE